MGKSSGKLVKVEFVEEAKPVLIVFIIAGIILILVTAVLLIRKYLLKNVKRK